MAGQTLEDLVKPGMKSEFAAEKWTWLENPNDPTMRRQPLLFKEECEFFVNRVKRKCSK